VEVAKAVGLVTAGSGGVQVSSALASGLFDRLGVASVSAARMGIGAVILLAATRPKLNGRSARAWRDVAVYGLAMALMNICLYLAVQRLPLGVAVTLEFLGPCAVALVSSRTVADSVCALTALAGVALIAGPGGQFDAAGFAAGAGAACCFGIYTLYAEKVGKSNNPMQDLALSVTVGAVVTSPFAVIAATRMDARAWWVLAAAALVGVVLPYAVDTLAARISSARVVGTLFAVDPAMGLLVGFLVLGQTVGPVELCGVALVTLSGSLLVWGARRPRPAANTAPDNGALPRSRRGYDAS
jgi:inner membrane transporter RhtA